ncbi:MAG: hypothetical protein N2Z23_08480 [Pyrinomonadaceae bacterium]|nr:hypothetical protein [Pyrinomonadaceae bacterium]MCX7640457.1 hypothetical protein [Pyrinomonadaceae bacterium]MDW8304884.1 hypothetical protein [Acidobacteriota bacterium]
MKEVAKLGETVEKRWRSKNYSENTFPEICADALEEAELPKKLSAYDVLKWVIQTTYLPEQRDLAAKFGDPPITIYNSPRFHIDVYFWLDGTTSIHQHSFCGAFQVFHGSSIHTTYEFELEESINVFTELGKIKLVDCELLKANDIRKILPGRSFIHSLFHLDQPSATIVIRTTRSPLCLPQYDYRKPNLAIDPFFDEPNITRKTQVISTLLRLDLAENVKIISEMLKNSDFQTSYFILSTIKSHIDNNRFNKIFGRGKELFKELVELVQRKHGTVANSLPEIFHYQERIQEITRRRSFVVDNELRFFLALLMNVEGKQRIFQLVKERFPNTDPVEKILDWVDQLASTKVLDFNLSNALGISDFSPVDLVILESLLRDFDGKQESQLFEDYGVNLQGEQISSRKRKLQENVIFEPLLA